MRINFLVALGLTAISMILIIGGGPSFLGLLLWHLGYLAGLLVSSESFFKRESVAPTQVYGFWTSHIYTENFDWTDSEPTSIEVSPFKPGLTLLVDPE